MQVHVEGLRERSAALHAQLRQVRDAVALMQHEVERSAREGRARAGAAADVRAGDEERRRVDDALGPLAAAFA